MSVTCGGSMIEAIVAMNQKSRPGKRMRANPYEHNDDVSSTPTSTAAEMISVLSVQRPNCIPGKLHASAKFAKWNSRGIIVGGNSSTSERVLSADSIIQMNGSRK